MPGDLGRLGAGETALRCTCLGCASRRDSGATRGTSRPPVSNVKVRLGGSSRRKSLPGLSLRSPASANITAGETASAAALARRASRRRSHAERRRRDAGALAAARSRRWTRAGHRRSPARRHLRGTNPRPHRATTLRVATPWRDFVRAEPGVSCAGSSGIRRLPRSVHRPREKKETLRLLLCSGSKEARLFRARLLNRSSRRRGRATTTPAGSRAAVRAFSIESSVSKSPAVGRYATEGYTSAMSSRLGRFITVSAAATMNSSAPHVGLEREPAT